MATDTAAEWIHTGNGISRVRGMRNAKRAVYPIAFFGYVRLETIMMFHAKVSVTAAIKSFTAAVDTLPSDMFMSMLGAVKDSTTNRLDIASFALEILLLRVLGHVKVTFTVSLPAKERLLAVVTLIKGRLSHCVLNRLFEPLTCFSLRWFHVNLLLLYYFLGKILDFCFEV